MAIQVLVPLPEKPTCFDKSVFQLSAPCGAWSLPRKWSCPTDSEVPAGVSGTLNFTSCEARYFTMAWAITSHRQSRYFAKNVRVRSHMQNWRIYLFRSPQTEKSTCECKCFFQWYPFLTERVIYFRYDIALRAMIYAFGIWRNGYYIILAKQVYHTAKPYIISRQRYIIEKSENLWYNLFDK